MERKLQVSANRGPSVALASSDAFSSDADAGVIQDARFKRKEALQDLAALCGKK